MTQAYRDILGLDLFSDSRGYLNATADALRTRFSGASEPSSPVAYMLWLDTTLGYLKERNAANDAWITLGRIGVDYGGALPVTGGTMSGPINMGSQVITNLGLGAVGSTAAARVQELDLKVNSYQGAFTGRVTCDSDPGGDNGLIRQSWAEARYLNRTADGPGVMAGPLTLAGDATTDLQAVPRQQVRDFVSFSTSQGHRHTGTDARRVLGTDIGSGSVTDNYALKANGSGISQWVPDERMHFLTGGEVLVATLTASQGWTSIDVSAQIPVTYGAYRTAIIKLSINPSSTLYLRTPGGSTAQTWSGASVATYLPAVTFIRMVNNIFEASTGVGGTGATINLLGYTDV
ncbi:MAG: hypothetical protein V2A73_21315 [Pseudomonadota bacterium]